MNPEENSNPLMSFIIVLLSLGCLFALAIQTWFYIDWLMGPTEVWMKYLTLCFFDIAGGIWLVLKLYHLPPSHATWQARNTAIVIDGLLSMATTIAWTYVFITRTPLSAATIADMVLSARWIVAFAVLFNSFAMIFYGVETINHWTKTKHPNKQRWATERVYSTPTPRVKVQQVDVIPPQIEEEDAVITEDLSTETSTNNGEYSIEVSTNKKKRGSKQQTS